MKRDRLYFCLLYTSVKADWTQRQNVAVQQPELLDSLKQNFFAEVDGYYRSEVEAEPLK